VKVYRVFSCEKKPGRFSGVVVRAAMPSILSSPSPPPPQRSDQGDDPRCAVIAERGIGHVADHRSMSTSSASVLVEPLDAYLRRRARSALALTPGEAVTIAVAMLRGCRRATGPISGTRWWLRADGCPVAVREDDGPDAIAAVATVFERLATMASDEAGSNLMARARESVLTQTPREWDALERRFFQHAAPLPLVLGPLTPVEHVAPREDARAASGSAARILALVDADIAQTAGEAFGDLRARWRSSRAIRWAAVGIAATLVAVVCVLAWPQPSPPGASVQAVPGGDDVTDPIVSPTGRQTSLPSTTHEPAAAAAETVAPSGIPSPDDPVASARVLFAALDRCLEERSCSASFSEDATVLHDPLLHSAATADVDLIDDFGGVVVVRVSRDGEMQYVTLVREKDRWLVRAVETVADQPS
jgi:hypothetical protein